MAEASEATQHVELRELYCQLTQPEFNVKALEFAQVDDKVGALEDELAGVKTDFRNRIGGLEAKRSQLRRIVLERREKRDVKCTWHADWASKSMLLRRDDTGEVIEARTMTPDEVQERFDFTDKNHQLSDQTDDSDPLNG
jgi:hypothetical protein